jgi:hypothetical protein
MVQVERAFTKFVLMNELGVQRFVMHATVELRTGRYFAGPVGPGAARPPPAAHRRINL